MFLRSYFEDRTAQLVFDGKRSERIKLTQGTPQGSPLSPVLFILFMVPLYRALEAHTGLITVGYADDTNLLAFGRDTQLCCRTLEGAYQTCEAWARERGMQFEPAKSELVHFTRTRRPRSEVVNILGGEQPGLAPVEAARFLGVWLDRKLSFKEHRKQVGARIRTQMLAQTRLSAKTYSLRILKARQIYTTVIRSVLSYRATAWHTPTPLGGTPRGLARSLQATQTRCLRVVTEAYKATPTRNLESEAWVPPIDLYLNRWVARTEQRLQKTGMAELLRTTCAGVASQLRRRRTRRNTRPLVVEPTLQKQIWAREWLQAHARSNEDDQQALSREWTELNADVPTIEEWKARRKAQMERAEAQRPRRYREAADLYALDPPARPLAGHEGLSKARSSLLTQARKGAIGVREFLFRRRVPGICTPLCRGGRAPETVAHLMLRCPDQELEDGRPQLRDRHAL
jgi:hypothetical protein